MFLIEQNEKLTDQLRELAKERLDQKKDKSYDQKMLKEFQKETEQGYEDFKDETAAQFQA